MVSRSIVSECAHLLEEIGFTQSEVKVYFALLKLGPSSTGPLVKESGVGSGKIYQVLDKLILKGLASHVIRNRIKEFSPQDPQNLIAFVDEEISRLQSKKEELNQLMSALIEEFSTNSSEIRAEVFEGIKGFKSCYEFILSEIQKRSIGNENNAKLENVYVLGAPQEALDKFKGYLLDWNERREKENVGIKILYNSDAKVAPNTLTLAQVRILDSKDPSPAWVLIYADYVVTMHVSGRPICFLIKDEVSAESYRAKFNALWKNAQK